MLRFHDGSAKSNWGGRLTSLALAALMRSSDSFSRVTTVNGKVITHGLAGESSANVSLGASLMFSENWRRFQAHGFRFDAKQCLPPMSVAQELLSKGVNTQSLASLVEEFHNSRCVVMNGEGDFILASRVTLYRSLVLMCISHLTGTSTHLVNTMLAFPTYAATDPVMVRYVAQTLSLCDSVVFRDSTSLDLCRRLFPSIACVHIPDALFSWSSGDAEISVGSQGPLLEGLDPAEALPKLGASVAISGSSLIGPESNLRDFLPYMRLFLAGLQRRGLSPILVSTCDRDEWLRSVAQEYDLPHVPSAVPLAVGAKVLSDCSALISGRYHPSILAATLGTPPLLMPSNSHKTSALAVDLELTALYESNFFRGNGHVARLLRRVESVVVDEARIRSRLQERCMRLAEQVVDGYASLFP